MCEQDGLCAEYFGVASKVHTFSGSGNVAAQSIRSAAVLSFFGLPEVLHAQKAGVHSTGLQ